MDGIELMKPPSPEEELLPRVGCWRRWTVGCGLWLPMLRRRSYTQAHTAALSGHSGLKRKTAHETGREKK